MNPIDDLHFYSEKRKAAIRAVAARYGESIAHTERHRHKEIAAVLHTALERAERKKSRGKPTNVDEEIVKVADQRAKIARNYKEKRDEHIASHTSSFIEIESKAGSAMARFREMIAIAKPVDFDGDEREILKDTLGKLRALLGLVEMQVTGEVNVDWDGQLKRLTD